MAELRPVVIGGGVIGLAVGVLLARAGAGPVVLEKEDRLGAHQTGRNSGVIHSGVYYTPGSMKAHTCRRGRALLLEYARERGVAHEVCGKVIVATEDAEVPRLDGILERGIANGVACRRIGAEELREIEPHARGVAALHVADAGIIDYRALLEAFASDIRALGGDVRFRARVTGIVRDEGSFVVRTTSGDVRASRLVNASGLQCDRVGRMTGAGASDVRVVPFRGEYRELTEEARRLCRGLIYPVPDPRFPFLGVHFTRMTDGSVECGPNAIPTLAREGYGSRFALNARDAWEAIAWPGFRRLCARHARMGAGEIMRSLSARRFVRALQRLVPEIRREDLRPAPCGIRAQNVLRDGRLLDDFRIDVGEGVINVTNAPSPAATACLGIAEEILGKGTGGLGD